MNFRMWLKKLIVGKDVCRLVMLLSNGNIGFGNIVKGLAPSSSEVVLSTVKRALKYDLIDVKKIANVKIYQLNARGQKFYQYLSK